MSVWGKQLTGLSLILHILVMMVAAKRDLGRVQKSVVTGWFPYLFEA